MRIVFTHDHEKSAKISFSRKTRIVVWFDLAKSSIRVIFQIRKIAQNDTAEHLKHLLSAKNNFHSCRIFIISKNVMCHNRSTKHKRKVFLPFPNLSHHYVKELWAMQQQNFNDLEMLSQWNSAFSFFHFHCSSRFSTRNVLPWRHIQSTNKFTRHFRPLLHSQKGPQTPKLTFYYSLLSLQESTVNLFRADSHSE